MIYKGEGSYVHPPSRPEIHAAGWPFALCDASIHFRIVDFSQNAESRIGGDCKLKIIQVIYLLFRNFIAASNVLRDT
jgi:hypothetical protein